VLVGVAVRYRLGATETKRFRDDVLGICERIKGEVQRQADADRTLITGFCEGNELVQRVGLAIDNGEIEDRRLSFSEIVRTERKAFGMDELLVAVEKGDIIGVSPTNLIGMQPSEVDSLIRADPTGYVLRTTPVPAIVTRCTKPSPSGRLVGMVAARHVDPMVDRIARTMAITVVPSWSKPASLEPQDTPDKPVPVIPQKPTAKGKHGTAKATASSGAGATESTSTAAALSTSPSVAPSSSSSVAGGAERTTCLLEDGRGATLPFQVVKSTRELEANLADIDGAILVLAIIASVAAFLVAVVFARSIGRPLAILAQEAGKVAAGEAQPIQVQGSGEVRELGAAFDRMIKDLAVTRRRLAAASRVAAWREVARRVAHEVKNPLAPIRAAVETLRRLRAREDPRFDEYFDEATRTVLDEVHRISNIVTEFTRFARLPPPRPQPLDVDEVARHVLQVHKAAAENGGASGAVRLSHFPQRPVPPIRADRDQVIQVLTNLVQNALDAVKDTPTPTVTLTTDTDGHYASFAVADNGPGISPEFAGRLFEPYATTKVSGTGLGLAIAQRIAYEHNGELSYAGVPQGGKGAIFRLVLPVEGPPLASEAPPPPSSGAM
jgi:signal transduction histidine kinase